MTVDTACSSSLVRCTWPAPRCVKAECDLALAGGVQTMSTPAAFVASSRQRVVAPDGRCKAFSAAADRRRLVRGCGVSCSSVCRRRIARVIAFSPSWRGSAVNQDGRSQGLTAPNGPSPAARHSTGSCCERLTPDDIDTWEAHGTGTSLGDPIEAGALARCSDRRGGRSTSMAGLLQVEHWPRAGGGGHSRCDQDGAGRWRRSAFPRHFTSTSRARTWLGRAVVSSCCKRRARGHARLGPRGVRA